MKDVLEPIAEKSYYRDRDPNPILTLTFLGEQGVNDPARPLPTPRPDTECPSCKGDKAVTVAGAIVKCRRCEGVGWVWGDKATPNGSPR